MLLRFWQQELWSRACTQPHLLQQGTQSLAAATIDCILSACAYLLRNPQLYSTPLQQLNLHLFTQPSNVGFIAAAAVRLFTEHLADLLEAALETSGACRAPLETAGMQLEALHPLLHSVTSTQTLVVQQAPEHLKFWIMVFSAQAQRLLLQAARVVAAMTIPPPSEALIEDLFDAITHVESGHLDGRRASANTAAPMVSTVSTVTAATSTNACNVISLRLPSQVSLPRHLASNMPFHATFTMQVMLLAPLAPRLPDIGPLETASARLLKDMMAALELPRSSQAVKSATAAVTARAQARRFEQAAAALLALLKADTDRVMETLADSMTDCMKSCEPWPEVCQRLEQNPTLQQPAFRAARQALEALTAAIAGGDATSSKHQQSNAAGAAAAAEKAAAALLQVCGG